MHVGAQKVKAKAMDLRVLWFRGARTCFLGPTSEPLIGLIGLSKIFDGEKTTPGSEAHSSNFEALGSTGLRAQAVPNCWVLGPMGFRFGNIGRSSKAGILKSRICRGFNGMKALTKE